MAFRAGSWISLTAMIIGIIILVVGVSLYEAYIGDDKSNTWWIWALIVLGLIMAVSGAGTTMVLLSTPEKVRPAQPIG